MGTNRKIKNAAERPCLRRAFGLYGKSVGHIGGDLMVCSGRLASTRLSAGTDSATKRPMVVFSPITVSPPSTEAPEIDGHIVAHGGVTGFHAHQLLAAAGGQRAQGDPLIQLHVIADDGGLTDDHTGARGQ